MSLICLTAVSLFSCLFSARDLQNILAAANEEGIVRLYNTESREYPLLKGILVTCVHNCHATYFEMLVAKSVLTLQHGWLMRMLSLISPGCQGSLS